MSEPLTLDELLIGHAAGRLAEPVALIVATHLAMSPESRRRYSGYEAIGGNLLERLEPLPLAEGALERAIAALDARPTPGGSLRSRAAGRRWPAPLCDYLPDDLASLRWRGYGPVIDAELSIEPEGYQTRVIRVKAGWGVPHHTHLGQELTLVLEGAFRDSTGRFGPGDLEIADGSLDHRPVAEADADCLCLAVTDAPLRLTGRVGRLLNPFLRL